MTQELRIKQGLMVAVVLLTLALQHTGAAQGGAPAGLRSVLEGTWTLEEWHADGQIMRPPEMTGRWMVYDGVVMATRHRNGPKDFQSTAGYGAYRITADEWIYGYERSEDASGPTAAEAKLRVTTTLPVPMQAWKARREGAKVILERDNGLRWEFDGPWFTLFSANGQVVRKYRKVQ